MLTDIVLSLQKSKKNNLWAEALLFHHLNNFRQKHLTLIFPKFVSEIEDTEVFYKLKSDQLGVVWASTNSAFLAVLKTNISLIENSLFNYLTEKQLILSTQILNLTFRRK